MRSKKEIAAMRDRLREILAATPQTFKLIGNASQPDYNRECLVRAEQELTLALLRD